MGNKLDRDYQALLQDILDNGHQKGDRTGTGTISVFGRQIRHKMSNGFPLLTTKKMYFKGIVTELLWFLRGDTNIKYLVDNDCHIWDGDAYKRYWNSIETSEYDGFGPTSIKLPTLTKEEFINKIKTDDEFAKKWGELGPIYGKQWRAWGGYNKVPSGWQHGAITHYKDVPIFDQIKQLIVDLKTNPDSRRLMVNSWNVSELDQMTLPPCHYGFQVYTRELSLEERLDLASKTYDVFDPFDFGIPAKIDHDEIDKLYPVPKRAISLMWNQRSVDTPLGLPFNIASYGLLLEIIAKMVDMVPDELIGNLGDTHIYSNQVEGCLEQIGKPYTHEERTEMLKDVMGEETYKQAISEIAAFSGGLSEYYDSYNIPKRTREPYSLPKLVFGKTDEFFRELGEDGLSLFYHLEPSDFRIEDYQSHSTIKFPLSN